MFGWDLYSASALCAVQNFLKDDDVDDEEENDKNRSRFGCHRQENNKQKEKLYSSYVGNIDEEEWQFLDMLQYAMELHNVANPNGGMKVDDIESELLRRMKIELTTDEDRNRWESIKAECSILLNSFDLNKFELELEARMRTIFRNDRDTPNTSHLNFI